MSIKNGLLTIPEDGDLFRTAGFYPKSLPGTSRLNSAAPRISRRVLHEWPLSRVEAAAFPDDPDIPQRIVKTQLSEASVERDFFRFAAPLIRNGRDGEKPEG